MNVAELVNKAWGFQFVPLQPLIDAFHRHRIIVDQVKPQPGAPNPGGHIVIFVVVKGAVIWERVAWHERDALHNDIAQ